MTIIGYALIIILVVGITVTVIGFLVYNRRINKIAKGELRDRHSPIPTPEATVNGVYKVVLMVVVVIALLSISALHGKVIDLQHSISNLQFAEHELYRLRDLVEQSDKRVLSVSLEVSDPDSAARTGKIHMTVTLEEYSEDTAVTLRFSGQSIRFEEISPGVYGAYFTGDLFAPCTEPTLSISDDGKTILEPVYDVFPEWIFQECLPLPGMTPQISSRSMLGRLKCEGAYTVWADHPNDIESVSLTYMTGGRDIKTLDITEKTVGEEEITLEKGLPLEGDLTFRIEILTKSGFKIVDQRLVCGNSDDSGVEGFIQIQDLNGNILWDQR
ncbi:MAG: hypothetical protein E7426_08675 [Ruminococcaceae bacterium]|jgi:hypothetical protein|nr:hypothetical protein [Oscillospiraceae bacterium]